MQEETEFSKHAVAQPLMQETVWFKQLDVAQAEAAFQQLSIQESNSPCTNLQVSPLEQEGIWLKQLDFEAADTWYHMVLAGTAEPKRLHPNEERSQSKKLRSDGKGQTDSWETKLQTEMAALAKSVKSIYRHLNEFQKTQQRKAQAIQDTVLRLNAANDACQNRLKEELSQSTSQIVLFRSLLKDVDSVIGKTGEKMHGKNWGQSKTLAAFCQNMSHRISIIDDNLNQCIDSCSGLQAEVPKAEINRIVGEIGKLSLFTKKQGMEKFGQKQEIVSKMLKDIMTEKKVTSGCSSDSSDVSLEGNVSGSISADDSGKEDIDRKANVKKRDVKKMERKSKNQGATRIFVGGNKNNCSSTSSSKQGVHQGAKSKSTSLTSKVNGDQSSASTQKKRNAQGSQSASQRKQEVFKFRGSSQSSKTPFLNQPGILGPRPSVYRQGGETNRSSSLLRFQNFNAMHQPSPGFNGMGSVNTLSPSNQSRLGDLTFNFSNLQQGNGSMSLANSLHGSGMGSMPFDLSSTSIGDRNTRSQLTRSALFQLQNRAEAVSQSMKSGLNYSHQRGMLPTSSQSGILNSQAYGISQGSMEHQLNEIAHKIQQMQLAASQDYHLQQLMQEAQRLKQLVAQKQHQHQQHDHFQQQFQVLINAFLQQQQMQSLQPQPKVAKSMPSHQQRQFHNRQYQLHQQKKQKQQQNKSQHFKQEGQQSDQNQSKKYETKGSASEKSSSNNHGTQVTASKRYPNKNSKLTRIGMFNPVAQGDKHRAGVSSMVVLESIGCLVVVDIINSCLKLYDVSSDGSSSNSLNHRLVTRLELPRPYYMTQLTADTVVISRAGSILSLVRVTKRRLEFLTDLDSQSQYYGLAYVADTVVACAAFRDNKIDMVCIQDDAIQTATLVNNCQGPELVTSMSATNSIIFLERVPDAHVRLVCVNTDGDELFDINFDSEPTSVWNIACIGDKVVCSNKETNKLKLYTKTGNFLSELNTPGGTVKQPFALAFSDLGNLYVANDGAWDNEFEHYVTTEINVFAFF